MLCCCFKHLDQLEKGVPLCKQLIVCGSLWKYERTKILAGLKSSDIKRITSHVYCSEDYSVNHTYQKSQTMQLPLLIVILSAGLWERPCIRCLKQLQVWQISFSVKKWVFDVYKIWCNKYSLYSSYCKPQSVFQYEKEKCLG